MPLLGKRDEAENRFKQAERYSGPSSKEFDLDEAIRLLEESILLKPDSEKYRNKLDEIREIKAKRNLKFSMQARNVLLVTFPEGERGVTVKGTVEQGTIREGDEIQIMGHRGTRTAKVYEVVAPTGNGVGVAGQKIRLAVVIEEDVGEGDVIEGTSPRTAE